MTSTQAGILTHEILHAFELAAMRLKARGLSDHTADRVGLFLALTTLPGRRRWTIRQAWEAVDRLIPHATPQAAAGSAATHSASTLTLKDQSNA